ncbi:MAG: DcrB-related protein [Ignavibacteriaceae bacterium]
MKIPDYYRQFQNDPNKDDSAKADPQKKAEEPVSQLEQKQNQTQQLQTNKKAEDKIRPYNADCFTLNMLEDWQDKTIYTLTGPVTDGIQHNVIINVDPEVPFENLIDYADWQIKTLEEELKSCTLLKRGEIKLDNGIDAYEAIFSWFPLDDVRIYQHQIFVLMEKAAYKLTASFTKKTRQTLGPQVLRMMLSFNTDNKNP